MISQEANKYELLRWLIQLEDNEIIDALLAVKHSQGNTDWADQMTAAERLSLERGLKDVSEGRVHSSKEFWDRISGKA